MNIFDILGKKVVETTTPLNLGLVDAFVFSNRLKKLLFVKTNNNYFIEFKKIDSNSETILVDKVEEIDAKNYSIINKECLTVSLEGKVEEKLTEIEVNNNGNNTIIKNNNSQFTYKDIYNSGNNLIILQGKNRKKPIKKNDTKNRDIVIVFPTEKNDIKLEELAPNFDNKISSNLDKNDISNFDKKCNINYDNLIKNHELNIDSDSINNKTTFTKLEKITKLPNKIVCNTKMLEGRTLTSDVFLNDKEMIKKNTTLTKQVINLALKWDKIVDITKNS